MWLLINNQRTTPVRRACSPTGPGDADANKGPRAVWSGRPTQREEGGRQQKGRQPLQPRKIFSFSALSEPQYRQYPHRSVHKHPPEQPRPLTTRYSPAERVDGRGFQPQFLSNTPGFHSDNMAARRRSRQERCMTGRDERERTVHCANREGREGGSHRTGPFVMHVCSLLALRGVFIIVLPAPHSPVC